MFTSALTVTLALIPQSPATGVGSAPQGEVAREIRHIPIREWIGRSADLVEPPLGSFLGFDSIGEPMALLGNPEGNRYLTEPDAILGFVHDFAPVDWDNTNVDMRIQGGTLQVAGPADQVQKVESTVRTLTRAFVHSVSVQAQLYRISRTTDLPVTATSAQLEQLVQNGTLQPVWGASGVCAAGNVISLGKERRTQYLSDVNVEVAQAAKIADPRVRELFEGVRVAVEPHVLVDTRDVVLCAQFAFGEQRGPLGTRSLGNEQHPTLEVPRVDCTSGTMSARLADGTAMLLSVQGDSIGGSNMALAITANRVDQGDGGGVQGVYPVSALLSKALRTRVENRDWEAEDREFPFHVGPSPEDQEHLDSDQLYQMIEESVGFDDSEDKLSVTAGHVIVQGRSEGRDAALRIVRGLQNQTLRTARVEAITYLDSGRRHNGIFGDRLATSEQAILHRLAFPTLLGRPHVLIRGHETTVIRDQDVEIAQKASISDPITSRVFSGVMMTVHPYSMQNGLGAEIVFDLLHAGNARHLVAETRDGGDLYLPEANRARLGHVGPTPSGRALQLGEGPTVHKGEQTHQTRQVVRITEQ